MIKTETLINYVFAILFVMFTCFTGIPFLKYIKVLLILILIVLAIFKRTKLNVEIIIILIIFVSYGLFSTIYGLILGNPGAIRSITVYLLWPILFVFFLGLLEEKHFNKIDELLVLVFKIIIFLCMLQIFESITGKLNFISTVFNGVSSQYIDLKNHYILISNPAINSILFILPYFISQALLNRNKKYIYLSLVGLIIPVITGRRAIILIIIASIAIFLFLIIIFIRKLKKDVFVRVFKKIKLLVITGFILFLVVFINYSTQFVNIFIINKVNSNTERSRQFISLLDGFASSPIIGHGSGAVSSVVRSVVQPWSYELFYVSILFHQGLIGIMLYIFAFLWIMINLLKIFKYNQNKTGFHVLSILVGLICFLIASATNPYIAKLDFMWVLFYPIAVINVFKRIKNK